MADLFCRLAVAYVIGEFLLDGKGIGRYPSTSWLRPVHVVAIVLMMVFFSLNYLMGSSGMLLIVGIVLLGVVHYLIDGTKSNGKEYETKQFIVAQVTQFALIGVLALIVSMPIDTIPVAIVSAYSNIHLPRYALGYSVALLGGNALINAALRAVPNSNGNSSDNIELRLEGKRLLTTGAWLGIIERSLIITLALLDQYTAIGIVFTAKAFARKSWEGDDFKGMYFLIGSLLSFLVAILAAVWIKYG